MYKTNPEYITDEFLQKVDAHEGNDTDSAGFKRLKFPKTYLLA